MRAKGTHMARFDISKYNATKTAATRTVKRGASAAEKRLMALQESSKRQRAKAKAEQNQTRQVGMAIGGGLVLGYAAQNGYLARVPRLGGMPTTVTTAVVGLVGGEFVGGMGGDILRAIGIASAVAAAYQLGSGQAVQGDQGGDDAVRRAVNQLAESIAGGDDFHSSPMATGAFVEV